MGSRRRSTARLGLGGMAGTLHDDAIVIDGLIIANFSRAVFLDMRRGGLTAANCTCSIWEGIRGSLDNVVRWQRGLGDKPPKVQKSGVDNKVERAP